MHAISHIYCKSDKLREIKRKGTALCTFYLPTSKIIEVLAEQSHAG